MIVIIAVVLVTLVAGVIFIARTPRQAAGPEATVAGLQADEDTGAAASKFARADAPRDFIFPEDYGPHNEFQTEWWYYTGNLQTAQGEHFGYQFTIFRRALTPGELSQPWSDFASNQIYFAHFAVTDSDANQHVAFEKYSRGAAGLAGAVAMPFHVFVEDWQVVTTMGVGGAGGVQIKASQGGYAIELNLNTVRPMVLQGNRGLSLKSTEPGNASYYYSFTHMDSRGTVTTPRGTSQVTGTSWMDREWSTSALGKNAVGWDWFALQLDDGAGAGRDIKLFQIRNSDGTVDPVSTGKIVERDGSTHDIALADMKLEPIETWRSPDTGATYPVKWRVTLLKENIVMELTPRVKDQEMKLSQHYWEGAMVINGTNNGVPFTGVGYLELTGYQDSFKGRF